MDRVCDFLHFLFRTHASAKGEIMYIPGGIYTILHKLVEVFADVKKSAPIVDTEGRIYFGGDLLFASFAPTRPQHDSKMRFS